MFRQGGDTVRTSEDLARDGYRSWRNHARHGAKPPSVVDAAGLHHRAWIVDHRYVGLRRQTGGGLQRRHAEVGIANGVKDQLMRWQHARRIEIVGDDHRRQKDAVVEQRSGRNVAAAGRNQLQHRDWWLGTAVRQAGNRMTPKALLKMMKRPRAVANVRQDRA